MSRVWPGWMCCLLLAPLAQAQAQPLSVEQWRAAELRFESTRTYARPFADVDVTVTFAGPRGLTLARPAYWDGGKVWRVRFAPVEPGTWTWVSTANDPTDSGLHNQRGSLQCVPYRGDLPIYRHGFLRVGADGRHLAHQDGTPFFWLADIHWLWESEHLDDANTAGYTSQFKGMVDRRAAAGFNVYQVELFGRWKQAGPGGTAATPEAEPNLELFQRNIDPKWQYLADHGVVVATTLGILDKAVTRARGEAEARMARYVCARYGAYPATWLMYQECTANIATQFKSEADRQVYLDVVRAVGTTYQRVDAYHHPRTAHSDASLVTAFRGEPWLDFTMYQGGHGHTFDRSPYLDFYFDPAARLPQIEGEADFERLFEGSQEHGAALVTTDDMREKAYQCLQAGCCGYSYAANGVWQATWGPEKSGNQTVYGNTPWYAGMALAGGEQMRHLLAFYTALPWTTLRPRPECDGWVTWNTPLAATRRPALTADAAANCVVVYCYRGKPFEGALHHLRDTPYQARWFDPRSGRYTELPDARPQAGTWPLPAQPDAQDWLLLLTARTPATAPLWPDDTRWLVVRAERADEAAHNLARGAKISASSTDLANKVYRPENAIDGRRDTDDWRHWSNDPTVDSPTAEKPVWLRLEWPQPVTIRKVVLYTMQDYEVADYALEYQDDTGWHPLEGGAVSGNVAVRREHPLQAPVTLRALRFLGRRGPAGQPTVVRVVELEAIGR